MTTPRDSAAAAALPDGRVLIVGGEGHANGSFLASAELFDAATDTFSATATMSAGRARPVAVTLSDGSVLVAGGVSEATPELYESSPEASFAGGDFGAVTVGSPSLVEPLVVSNLGAQALTISGVSLRGAQATPSSLALSGTGVAPNSGPAGSPGPAGPTGATEASAPAGSLRTVTCTTSTKTVKSHGHKRKVKVNKCTTHVVTGTATFTTAAARVTLARDNVVYATGTASRGRVLPTGRGGLRLCGRLQQSSIGGEPRVQLMAQSADRTTCHGLHQPGVIGCAKSGEAASAAPSRATSNMS